MDLGRKRKFPAQNATVYRPDIAILSEALKKACLNWIDSFLLGLHGGRMREKVVGQGLGEQWWRLKCTLLSKEDSPAVLSAASTHDKAWADHSEEQSSGLPQGHQKKLQSGCGTKGLCYGLMLLWHKSGLDQLWAWILYMVWYLKHPMNPRCVPDDVSQRILKAIIAVKISNFSMFKNHSLPKDYCILCTVFSALNVTLEYRSH